MKTFIPAFYSLSPYRALLHAFVTSPKEICVEKHKMARPHIVLLQTFSDTANHQPARTNKNSDNDS
jgi:hypothetical protein